MGLLVPDSGGARIGGLDVIADRVQLKRSVGYVPDAAPLYEYLTGGELLRFVGTVHGLAGAALRERCLALVDEFALGEVVDDYVMSYSLGMRKKLLLALATIHQPSVLLLDEPTSGLDIEATTRLSSAVRRWSAEGRTVLLSTHRLDFLHDTCDYVAVLRRGQLAWTGRPHELTAALAGSQDSALNQRA
jgi:ABC-type multidrug transport system ATPase subunit